MEAATFVALDATRTSSVQLRDVFISADHILADPAADYIKRIRAGFLLLQAGIGPGLARNCIDVMRQERASLGHVNKYIDRQPEDIEAALTDVDAEVQRLAVTPLDPGPDDTRRVLEAATPQRAQHRSRTFHDAAQAARGYVKSGTAQRRRREACFIAIVTPATKHLRKMLAE